MFFATGVFFMSGKKGRVNGGLTVPGVVIRGSGPAFFYRNKNAEPPNAILTPKEAKQRIEREKALQRKRNAEKEAERKRWLG